VSESIIPPNPEVPATTPEKVPYKNLDSVRRRGGISNDAGVVVPAAKIEEVLLKHGGKRRAAAEELGIQLQRLHVYIGHHPKLKDAFGKRSMVPTRGSPDKPNYTLLTTTKRTLEVLDAHPNLLPDVLAVFIVRTNALDDEICRRIIENPDIPHQELIELNEAHLAATTTLARFSLNQAKAESINRSHANNGQKPKRNLAMTPKGDVNMVVQTGANVTVKP
jgi:hypothetical protein